MQVKTRWQRWGREVVKMSMKYKVYWVLEECTNNKIVPEVHFVALLQLKAPARAISVESTLALNPWCFGAKVVYVHTPGTHPPHCEAIHDSLSVLHKLEKKVKKLGLYFTWQITAPQLHSLYPTHANASCSQVPPKGTQEHKAIAWTEHKLWRWGAVSHKC